MVTKYTEEEHTQYLARRAARPKSIKMTKFLRLRGQEFLTNQNKPAATDGETSD